MGAAAWEPLGRQGLERARSAGGGPAVRAKSSVKRSPPAGGPGRLPVLRLGSGLLFSPRHRDESGGRGGVRPQGPGLFPGHFHCCKQQERRGVLPLSTARQCPRRPCAGAQLAGPRRRRRPGAVVGREPHEMRGAGRGASEQARLKPRRPQDVVALGSWGQTGQRQGPAARRAGRCVPRRLRHGFTVKPAAFPSIPRSLGLTTVAGREAGGTGDVGQWRELGEPRLV